MLLTKAEEISDIAFGFMGSKALFAALHFGIFTHLKNGPLSTEELAEKSGLHPERCQTLLTAVTALGLVSIDDGRYTNSPERLAGGKAEASHQHGFASFRQLAFLEDLAYRFSELLSATLCVRNRHLVVG